MNNRFAHITIEKAKKLKNHGQTALAHAMLDDALSLFPGNVGLLLERYASLFDTGVDTNLENLPPSVPENSSTLYQLGCLLAERGLYPVAREAFTKAIVANNSHVWAYNNLGLSNIELGRRQEAYTALVKAVELRPDSAKIHNNLANLYMLIYRLSDAVKHYQRAIELDPKFVDAYSNLGRAYCFCGDTRASETIHKALELDSTSRSAVDVLLFTSNYFANPPANIFEEHKRWATSVYFSDLKPTALVTGTKNSKIHIGYASADFRNHPVATFFEPVLRHFNRQAFEVYCYAQVPDPDATTTSLQNLGGNWRSTVGLSDHEMADLVRQDHIDIFVDLSGFTKGHRLGVFTLKPAPIQCSWLGYPNTTGLPQIDYRITDAIADPPGLTDHLYTEKLIRLPRTFLCYAPGTSSPTLPIAPGPITFCCFNHLPKVSDFLISMWARILKEVPETLLLMKSTFFADPVVCNMIRSRFKWHDINPERIVLREFTATKQEHLDLYGSCHIALDTYPYHGTTTTCEALWMGVPVVTLAGTSHVSRVGASILESIRAPELITYSCDEYVHRAVELARDPERVAHYRHALRPLMQDSALMDAEGFVSDLEAAFRKMLKQ